MRKLPNIGIFETWRLKALVGFEPLFCFGGGGIMDQQSIWDILRRDAAAMYSYEGVQEKLVSGRRLKIKFGADPSRPDLHLGHSVVLRKLRLLQDMGHEIIFVIGDFTGMIGDPSGKSKTRPPLTFEETRKNGETYFRQVSKILDPAKASIEYNSKWLGAMNFADVLNLCGQYTVARILERDDFSARFKEGRAIGMHELLYPLMQGYDSVALGCDIEVGGTDQTFNLLVGRELQRSFNQPPQEVITFPLLPGLDGFEKMSKSLDNYIGIDEPAGTMFEKCMKVPDALLCDYFRLTSDISCDEYLPLITSDIRAAHMRYAMTVTAMYHDGEKAEQARIRYLKVAAGEAPESIPVVSLPGGLKSLARVLMLSGLAASVSEAGRLIAQGGIAVDGEIVQNARQEIDGKESLLLRRGKNRFVRIKFQ
jgi:tyrosyl-tRNA synthetase